MTPSAARVAFSPFSILPSATRAVRFARRAALRDEHRVMADIGAAQVGEPCNVVQCRNEVMGGPGLAHFLATAASLAARGVLAYGRHARNRRNRQVAHPRTLGQDIEVGAQADAFGGQRGFERATGGKSKDVASTPTASPDFNVPASQST